MTAKEIAYIEIKKLVDKFASQPENYKSSDYNETLTRRDFIDPFFEALGWDINNKQDVWESYREVVHEDRIKIGGVSKAPDYSFRLQGGNRLFFVEAKKPRVNIKDDFDPAYQIRLYGYNAGLPVSLITDFEEFAVYDCRKKPKKGDKPSAARIEYFKYTEYLSKFDFIWDTFSREQVIKGGLVKYARTEKKGTATVDKDFLQSLDEWRTLLAASIHKNNTITEDELNYSVQQTIDRLIFLRFAEDRGIEPYGNLKASLKTANHYQDLFRLFNAADQRYNSGLFHFRKEKENPAQEDRITGNLIIDNKTIKAIITGLYENDYLFSVIPVEILGSAYEQFLGKQVTIKGNKAVIEEKPEVRKAGGVYYTPQYIVEYIVKQTVGKLCEGKTPAQVSKIKIVDPACGSGSFLLGTYQYLLNWHLDYYKDKGESPKKKSEVLTPDGSLSTKEKKRILLNNIYGVDIDSNAVEVTKLSLLLKCMEGETGASVNTQMKIVHERVLPSLENNIKSGNSLIDLDYYDGEIEFGHERTIKPFSWQQSFPNVFKQGGFDAVVGNPPWVDLKGHDASSIKYYFLKYATAENRINLYALFVEKGLTLLNPKGKFGFIIPSSILYQSSYEKIRKHILTNYKLDSVVRLPDNTFQNVKAETVILTIGESKKTTVLIYDRRDLIFEVSTHNAKEINFTLSKKWLNNQYTTFDIFTTDSVKELLLKIEQNKISLDALCDFALGITPYDKYQGHTSEQIINRVFHSVTAKNKTFKPLLEGADVKRYSVLWGKKEYLSYGDWLGAPREKRFFTSERILVRQIVSGNPLTIYAGYTNQELYNTQSIFNILVKDSTEVNIKYILALLNSRLINFYHSNKFLDLSKNLFQKILIQNCKRLPVFVDAKSSSIHDEVVNQVNKMLEYNEQLQTLIVPEKIEALQQRIKYTDNKINQLVYQLYGLTEDEIKIVEGV